jgi:hypothetical protein
MLEEILSISIYLAIESLLLLENNVALCTTQPVDYAVTKRKLKQL